jgi:ATP-dependent Clp protease ATP-binding subunit ClpA
MTTQVKYNDYRFEQLAEKISRIQNFELKNPDLYTNLETKLESLEVDYRRYLKDYEFKYTHLEEDIKILLKMINTNKELREETNTKFQTELKSFENQLKQIFSNEREYITTYTNNIFKSLEDEFNKIKTLLNKERESFHQSCRNIHKIINDELPKLNSYIDAKKNETNQHVCELRKNLNEEVGYLNSLVCNL